MFRRASEDLRKALELDSLRLSARAQLGRLLSDWAFCPDLPQGMPEKLSQESIDALQIALRAQPNELGWWIWLGAAWIGQGMLKREELSACLAQAEGCYLRSLKLTPSTGALLGLGGVYAMRGESLSPGHSDKKALFRKAMGYAERATTLDPKSAYAWHDLGLYQAKSAFLKGEDDPLGLLRSSVESLGKAVEMTPWRGEYWVELGKATSELAGVVGEGDEGAQLLDQALTAAEKAIELEEDSVEAHFLRARTLHNMASRHSKLGGEQYLKTLEASQTSFRRVVRTQPNRLLAWRELGDVGYLLGDEHARMSEEEEAQQAWVEAREALNEAIRINDGDAKTRFVRGRVHARMGLKSEVLDDFKRCLDLDPSWREKTEPWLSLLGLSGMPEDF